MKTVEDSFVRTDSTDLGADWDAGYTSVSNLQIVSNRVRGVSTTIRNVETNNRTEGYNQFAQIRLDTFTGAALREAAVMLRHFPSPRDVGYEFLALRNDGAAMTSRIRRKLDGGFITMAESATQTWVAGDILRGAIFENTMFLFRNGIPVLRTQNNLNTQAMMAGRTGVFISSATLADVEISSFFSGEVAGPIKARYPLPYA